MIQGRDLFKVILAVAAILALVFAALHFANSSGKKSSLSGDIPKLVISGTNSAGAVPALENFSSRINTTNKSGYTGTLATKYRARQPVDCLAGSKLSFAFTDGEPDKLRAYFSYYAKGVDKSDLFSEEYEALVYGDSITLPTQGLDFQYYIGELSNYIDAGGPSTAFSSVAFYRLVATWDEEEFEYVFAVNLEDAETPGILGTKSDIRFSLPRLTLSGINAEGESVSPDCLISLNVGVDGQTDYIDALESLYKPGDTVILPAGSMLTLSFPNGEPDDISCYYIFRANTFAYSDVDMSESTTYEDPETAMQEELKRITLRMLMLNKYEKQTDIDNNNIRLPDFSQTFTSDKASSTDNNNPSIVYFKLLAAWGADTYEYIFAVNLE